MTTPLTPDQPLTVVAAAIMFDGKIHSLPAPARHHDIIRQMHESGLRNFDRYQGFVLSDGTFATRRRAFTVAMAAGQVTHRRPGPGNYQGTQLLSEDVW